VDSFDAGVISVGGSNGVVAVVLLSADVGGG
jgi:hypothetical protein